MTTASVATPAYRMIIGLPGHPDFGEDIAEAAKAVRMMDPPGQISATPAGQRLKLTEGELVLLDKFGVVAAPYRE